MAYKILWGQSDGLLLFINAGKKCIINHFDDDLWVFIYLFHNNQFTSTETSKLVILFYLPFLLRTEVILAWKLSLILFK